MAFKGLFSIIWNLPLTLLCDIFDLFRLTQIRVVLKKIWINIFGSTYFSRRFNLVQESMVGRHSKAPNTQFYREIVPKKIQLGTSLFWDGTLDFAPFPPQKEDYLKSPIISVQMLLSFMVNCHLHFFMRSKATLLCGCIMAIPPQKVFVFGYQSAYISVSPLFVFWNDFNTM